MVQDNRFDISRIYDRRWQLPFAEVPAVPFHKGEVVVSQGETVQQVFLIVKGKLRFSILTTEGQEKILFFMNEGGLIADASAISGRTYKMTVTANEASSIAAIDGDRFLDYLLTERTLLKDWIAMQEVILENLAEQIMDLTYRQREAVVAKYLLRLGQTYGEPTAEGLFVNTRVTHQVFADLIGCSRVTVSRILARLDQLQIIRRQAGRFVLLDQEKLQRLAED